MQSLLDVFASPDRFRQEFESGLLGLLEAHEGLGVFILVQANAAFDSRCQSLLDGPLADRFERLAGRYRTALAEGLAIADSDDDLMVFLKLLAVGRDGLEDTRRRRAGSWELQFNPMRSFRPKRMANARVEGISRPFDRDGFNFNKPFLRKEVFWSGSLLGRELELLFNKFPFAPLHGLLVPDREAEQPQLLIERDHHFVWAVIDRLGETLPGVSLGYNAYGAFASVNHLHFQMFLREQPLPLESAHWKHNGGDTPYPCPCEVYTDDARAWTRIADLHDKAITYNAIYRPGRLYILPRRQQGHYQHSPWTQGFSFYEMAGVVTTFGRTDFDALEEEAITRELGCVGNAGRCQTRAE
ncbi:MAG: hypothetical protein ACPGUC_03555 [Gammaproteobacteria bacterium]